MDVPNIGDNIIVEQERRICHVLNCFGPSILVLVMYKCSCSRYYITVYCHVLLHLGEMKDNVKRYISLFFKLLMTLKLTLDDLEIDLFSKLKSRFIMLG